MNKGKSRLNISKYRVPPLTFDRFEEKNIRIIGKGGKERMAPIPRKILRGAGITRAELKKNLPLKVSRRAIQHFIEKLGNEVLGKHITFHQFRHGFCTHALESGIKIHDVQRFAGHSRMDTTGLYLHSNPKRATEKYEEVF